jgi:geranylgeranyl transferase type-2 subunit beta
LNFIKGECDTRFSYCALSCLHILNKLNEIDVNKACEFVLKCRNYDGSFGGLPEMYNIIKKLVICFKILLTVIF